MIDFDDMHLPKDNLDFLCKRYSNREAEVPDGASKKQRNEILHAHLTTLREEHAALRDTLLQSFMDAIKESLNAQDEAGQHEEYLIIQLSIWIVLKDIEGVPQGLCGASNAEGIDPLVLACCKDALHWQDVLFQFWLDLLRRCLEGLAG